MNCPRGAINSVRWVLGRIINIIDSDNGAIWICFCDQLKAVAINQQNEIPIVAEYGLVHFRNRVFDIIFSKHSRSVGKCMGVRIAAGVEAVKELIRVGFQSILESRRSCTTSAIPSPTPFP